MAFFGKDALGRRRVLFVPMERDMFFFWDSNSVPCKQKSASL